MKYWEFLIQKEGDQTWLPLETQQVEILEGRYRVVAHTDRANTPVDIRVSQLITNEMPPRKRVRKRTGSTNESGLVVVMPFVHLKPGQWKVQCSSVGDDELDSGWQYDVQLQVFAPSEDDWSGEWPVPQDAQGTSSISVDAGASDEHRVNADLPLLQAQAELQQQVDRSTDGADDALTRDRFEGAGDLVYRVALKQQAYLSQRDQPMTIVGKVSALTDAPGEAASQLWIRLQNPETAGVIMEAHRPLSLARLPADFKVQIQLPNDVKTRVVLGEVSLRTAAIDGDRSAKVLASTAFTITAGIDQILDAIANQDSGSFEEEISFLLDANSMDLEVIGEPSVPSFDLSTKTVTLAEGSVLPPQLDSRLEGDRLGESLDELPTQTGSSLIDLPTFEQTALDQSAFDSIPPSQLNQLLGEQLIQQPDREPAASLDEDANQTALNTQQSYQPIGLPTDRADTPPIGDPFNRPAVQPVSMPSMVSAPAQFVGTSIEDSDLEADEIAAVLDDIDQDLLDEPSELDALEAPGIEGVVSAMPRTSRLTDADSERGSNRAALPAAEKASSLASPPSQRRPARKSGREVEANLAFQSLKLKDHFWQRLSNLNRQSHREATKLAENMEAAGVRRSRGDEFSALSSMSSTVEDYAGDEVVIYDEPLVSDAPAAQMGAGMGVGARFRAAPAVDDSVSDSFDRDRTARTASRPAQPALSDSQTTSRQRGNEVGPDFQNGTSSSDEELPEMALPVISLPMGDLVAGQLVTVTVRSRPSAYKPFIKLWMVDRQSRSLVIEPKILTNLTPDVMGDLQGTTDLQVPMDCLDVQIAAIAIDMATQQESGKAVVNRRVSPANQPSTRGRFNL